MILHLMSVLGRRSSLTRRNSDFPRALYRYILSASAPNLAVRDGGGRVVVELDRSSETAGSQDRRRRRRRVSSGGEMQAPEGLSRGNGGGGRGCGGLNGGRDLRSGGDGMWPPLLPCKIGGSSLYGVLADITKAGHEYGVDELITAQVTG